MDTETVALEQAAERVLAESIAADRDSPPTARSVRDGFAVHAADLPGPLRVIGEARAGSGYPGVVGPGEAVEIMTGAPVPEGADAVIMVEYSTREGDRVRFDRRVPVGDAINPQGHECRKGDEVLHPGQRIDYSRIGVLASVGRSEVRVFRQPRVAILATGDEVVDIDQRPADHQVRNSNAWSLAAQVRRAGGIPWLAGIARDDEPHTRELIEGALAGCDLLLLSGGVSAGKYDVVERVLADLGAEFFFDRVKIQPGQPAVFGRAQEKFFFGLPGNPLSTMVTFEVFARAALELLGGAESTSFLMFEARLTAPFHQRAGLTRFLPARLSADGREITALRWKGSSDIPTIAQANALLVSDPEREAWDAGEMIRVMVK